MNDTSLATITITPQPSAGADGGVTVCDSSIAAIDLFSLIYRGTSRRNLDALFWYWGCFQRRCRNLYAHCLVLLRAPLLIPFIGASPCVNDTSLATITITPQPSAGADGGLAVCDSSVAAIDLFSLISGEQAGGTWTRSSGIGGVFSAAAGTYTPALGATSSTFTYTLHWCCSLCE